MKDKSFGRRDFLKSAAAGSAAAATFTLPETAQAQKSSPPAAPPASAGYSYLNPDEAAFIEALVDHMVPADEFSPKGTDLGINIFIDRALAAGWGQGDRLYMNGPWQEGTPSQGYQLPLSPAELYRAGIHSANAHCVKHYGRLFDRITPQQRQEFLVALSTGKIKFDPGPPSRVFWGVIYQNVIEGMFADPIYGGNRDKAGWKMIGFPGVVAVHGQNITNYRNKKFLHNPAGIADMS
jgi:gluconate 2-dehydrogenase gamma chain